MLEPFSDPAAEELGGGRLGRAEVVGREPEGAAPLWPEDEHLAQGCRNPSEVRALEPPSDLPLTETPAQLPDLLRPLLVEVRQQRLGNLAGA